MFLLLLVAVSGRHVALDAVGDVMPARWVGRRIEREGAPSAFAGVRKELRRADLVVGNLESALTSAVATARKPIVLRADPRTIGALRDGGFAVLSLANNHAQDCGAAGVAESRHLLSSAGIAPLGPSAEPVVLTRNGLKIGFVGLMDLPPEWLDRKGPWQTTFSKLRSKVDVVVAIMHWGIEGISVASGRQVSLARRLADLGVDLILGCHPHVLQPIRWLSGPHGRRCLVAYSLGNFLFDARPGPERQSMILSVNLSRHGVESYRTHAVRIDRGYPTFPRTDLW